MEVSLRELKKEQTRQLIADTAWHYFPTKEDLFFFRLEAFGARLLEAIRTRAPGEPALVAFRRHLLTQGGLLAQLEAGDAQALERLRTVHRLVAASPALLAREQKALASSASSLAELLAAETGAPAHDVRAQVAANALIGVQRTLIGVVRRRVLADDEAARLAADVRKLGNRAFALLERGLGDYATKPASRA